jgi:hypothetical protein
MAKAYWVACYHSTKNPDALAAYAKLAGLFRPGGCFISAKSCVHFVPKLCPRGIKVVHSTS